MISKYSKYTKYYYKCRIQGKKALIRAVIFMGKNYDSQWELIVIMLYEIKITSNYISQNPLIFYVEFFF